MEHDALELSGVRDRYLLAWAVWSAVATVLAMSGTDSIRAGTSIAVFTIAIGYVWILQGRKFAFINATEIRVRGPVGLLGYRVYALNDLAAYEFAPPETQQFGLARRRLGEVAMLRVNIDGWLSIPIDDEAIVTTLTRQLEIQLLLNTK